MNNTSVNHSMTAEDSQKVLDAALEGCEQQPRTYAIDLGQPQAVLTSVTDNVQYLAEGLCDYYGTRVGNFPSVDEVSRYLATLVALRCDQINKHLEKGVQARDIPVPDFYFPFLAKIGRYEDELGTRVLVPTSIHAGSGEEQEGARADGAELYSKMNCDQVLRMGRRLKAAGVKVHYGLPVVTAVVEPTLFRVRQDSQGLLFTGDHILSTADVFVRTLVWYEYLEAEFGQANICYGNIHGFRASYEALLSMGAG